MGRLIKSGLKDFSADSVRAAAERSPADYGLHIAANRGRPTKNREVPIKNAPAGVIPQKDGKHHPVMEMQKPVNPHPDSEQARIRMIATEMVRRAVERRRFFAEPLREMDEGEEAIRSKK